MMPLITNGGLKSCGILYSLASGRLQMTCSKETTLSVLT